MKRKSTILNALENLNTDKNNHIISQSRESYVIGPKKETISNIISYAKSVSCYKTRSIDRILLNLN